MNLQEKDTTLLQKIFDEIRHRIQNVSFNKSLVSQKQLAENSECQQEELKRLGLLFMDLGEEDGISIGRIFYEFKHLRILNLSGNDFRKNTNLLIQSLESVLRVLEDLNLSYMNLKDSDALSLRQFFFN